ncbi:MAG: hypothetical protein E6R13_02685 [Spirochaetes bacterium]|nr:MAG: hypothetical protein E6R13_02685 [Spirochaetota bacterium]
MITSINEFKLLNESADYLSWKRKNVTLRGMKDSSQENGVSGMLGKGLYTAPLSNKSLAKQYGDVYFVVGGIPKKPLKFNTLNEWEIWFYNTLVMKYTNGTFPDIRQFNAQTTIEKELQKMGYDGIIIKGREMVNFKPENYQYFRTEEALKDYYYNL